MTWTTRVVAWRRVHEGQGHSMARVERLEDGWLCSAAEVLASVRETVACTFRVRLDAEWVTREVVVSAIGVAGERQLHLSADEDRCWERNGRPAEDLAGCVDVDVAATPFTLTVDEDGLVADYKGFATRVEVRG